ncbi:MAG: type II toxin-antitoxin system RelE/ParE family toxin [Janthinobacterium lividum]
MTERQGVVFSTAAMTDLAAIGDYIATDNPPRAESFVQELIDSCAGIEDMPRAFPLVPRYEDRGIRRRRHGRYLIFYRIGRERIDILHILHGAQDYEWLLFSGG